MQLELTSEPGLFQQEPYQALRYCRSRAILLLYPGMSNGFKQMLFQPLMPDYPVEPFHVGILLEGEDFGYNAAWSMKHKGYSDGSDGNLTEHVTGKLKKLYRTKLRKVKAAN